MEIWTIQDKLDPQARATAHIVYTWYLPPQSGRPSQICVLEVTDPPPPWVNEPGVICAETIRDDAFLALRERLGFSIRAGARQLLSGRVEYPQA